MIPLMNFILLDYIRMERKINYDSEYMHTSEYRDLKVR